MKKAWASLTALAAAVAACGDAPPAEDEREPATGSLHQRVEAIEARLDRLERAQPEGRGIGGDRDPADPEPGTLQRGVEAAD